MIAPDPPSTRNLAKNAQRTASPVALGRAVPILADAVKVLLKFEEPIFTL
jgi:hypothetical protein